MVVSLNSRLQSDKAEERRRRRAMEGDGTMDSRVMHKKKSYVSMARLEEAA